MTTNIPQPASETIGQRIGNVVKRLAFQRSRKVRACAHPQDTATTSVPSLECPSCTRDGTEWVKLRMCLTCGTIGCCDSSVGRHAVGHFERTGHPVMRSIEPGDAWGWCYVDEAYLTLAPAA